MSFSDGQLDFYKNEKVTKLFRGTHGFWKRQTEREYLSPPTIWFVSFVPGTFPVNAAATDFLLVFVFVAIHTNRLTGGSISPIKMNCLERNSIS